MMLPRRVALTVALAVLLVGCSSGSGKGSTNRGTLSPTIAAAVHSSTHLPHGWKRFSYGSLSVGAPATWKVSRARPPNCGPRPSNTVSEYTVTTVEVSNCPDIPANTSTPPAISIECLRGAANGLFSGSATTTVAGRTTLHHNGLVVWLPGRGWEGAVVLPNNATLGRVMLATVEPTVKPC
jgi:hypothetical protein